MEQTMALLEIMCNAQTKDGRMPKNFRLPAENDDQKKFMEGTIDGILMYHTKKEGLVKAEELKMLTDAIDLASDGKQDEAVKLVEKFAEEGRVLPLVDDVHAYVSEKQDSIDPGKLLQFAVYIFSRGTKREVVKFGLCLIELFDVEDMKDLADYIRLTGTCDEFTLYVAHIMRNWKNGNDEIFAMIQKVFGWGRIFAMELLEPTTDEIRDWMVSHAIRNVVAPQYNALTVALKCDLLHMMRGNLNVNQFLGIVDVVGALLNEKPVPGISGIKDPQIFMEAFDECLIQNASLLQKDMNDTQKEYINQILNARDARRNK